MSPTREPFSIHPALEAHIDPLSEEETRMLEESLLAEGCRDPLVVWREENVLVDGHNRKRICDAHGLSYQVVYRSFGGLDEAKSWMDLNQLGRRNLTREKRDEMIRRLAASGVPKPEIAAAVGLNLRSVQRLAAGERQDVAERPINTTTAAQELQAKQAEVEALRRQVAAAKEAESRVRSRHLEALEDLETHKRELRRLQAAPPQVAERVVEVVKEVPVIPPEVQERIAALEKERDQLAGHIEKARAERRDIDDLLRRKVEIQKALKDLQGQQDEAQTLRQYQAEMALAVREIRLCLEKNKGAVDRLSKEGLPSDAWDARVILNTAALCREVGDLLDVAVQTISIRGMTPRGEEVTVHVERP